ncbi:hypothetical protein E6P09_09695 [Haloferax mediterranei ATCC 33500]|uniref:DUF8070 domain-containing protein n=1 Tax=Haloferax mediterranei (strain ATCC 33500 / DSM 1411 / JCM 8866 / NBRC 14739 / NCIMB 2177 / R-4) TaxID=523841 RepID=A0A4P8P4S8_HALMT|nr:hypothetical protein E6P09_09695 [Haloferax mediterranei ATCC 33500]
MDKRVVAVTVLIYTILAGIITVGAIYLTTHSGLYLVLTAIIGVVLVALGGGQAGRTNVTSEGVQEKEAIGRGVVGNIHLPSTSGTDSTRIILICYGLGLFLWSVIILQFFRSGLQ